MEEDQRRQWRSLENALSILMQECFQTPRILKRRDQLAEVENEVRRLYVMQAPWTTTRGGGSLVQMRKGLRKHHLNPISTDGMLILDGEPGIEDQLRLPHNRIADRKLVTEARRIIKNAKPFADTYIEEGYAPDFIEKAEQAVDEFERRISAPNDLVAERGHATATLPSLLLKGRKIIRAITRIVEDELAKDPVAQKLWKTAKRLPGTMGRPKNNQRGRRIYPPPEDNAT